MNTYKAHTEFFNSIFFKTFIVIWVLAIVLLFALKQGDVVLLINKYSIEQLDIVVLGLTEIGNGITALGVILVLLFVRYYYALNISITMLLVSLFVNLGKRTFFFQHNRPLWTFHFDDFYRVLHHVPLNYMRSFPSGHTMTAFGLFAALAILFPRKWWSALFIFFAVFVGYSRIYLCQHYFVDTVWGGIMGVLAAITATYITNHVFKLKNKAGMQKSLLTVFKN